MIRLLLIEDDKSLSYIIKSYLEEILGGYEVKAVTNGEEGLQALKEYKPDIIVSDIDMPVLDGIEMVKRIRLFDTDMPILFATGRTGCPHTKLVELEASAASQTEKEQL